MAACVNGEVSADVTPSPPKVLSAAEELVIEDLLVYAGSHCLGVSRQQLAVAVYKLCIDDVQVPWSPEQGLGKAWFAAFFKRHSRLAVRGSLICEANCVIVDE